MTPRYLRNEPSRADSVAAAIVSGALAATIGVVTFYFIRLLVTREVVGDTSDRESSDPDSGAE
jgi:hypothetical protein